MKALTPRTLLLLPWLSLPLVGAAYLLLWDVTPERLAVHFDRALRPNGWLTRGQSLVFDLAVLLFILVTSSIKLRMQGPGGEYTNLILQYLAVGFLTLVFLATLVYNIMGSPF